MSRDGGLMNECARVCVCACHRCRRQNCNQITAAHSSPASSTTSGAASVNVNTDMLPYTLACGSVQAAGILDVCVMNNSQGLAQIKRSGLSARLTTRSTNS